MLELRELPSFDIPCNNTIFYHPNITTCDELLFYNFDFLSNKTALCNPWLRQVRCIEPNHKPWILDIHVVRIGYNDSRPEKVYKILSYYPRSCGSVVIYDCASNALKFIDTPNQNCPMRRSNVSLNGNLYWITRNRKTLEYFFIQSFDFLTENFKPFGLLPWQKNNTDDHLIIAVYKGDRFSLLTQCYETKKIEIWVMEKKIDREEEEMVWINLMTMPTTTLPRLSWKFDHIIYFIYDKTLFMCCSKRGTGVDCIYIVRKDPCKEIQIDHGLIYCCHRVYTPNLISIPLL